MGLESNASELVLHVEQTVRACAIDHVGRWMVPRLRGSNHTQKLSQVRLAQNDDMVQAFSSDRWMKNR